MTSLQIARKLIRFDSHYGSTELRGRVGQMLSDLKDTVDTLHDSMIYNINNTILQQKSF